MKIGSLVQLEVPLRFLPDPFPFIEDLATGKKILNIGAAGGVETYLPGAKDLWLHERLQRKASQCVGVDIDKQNIEHARKYDYDILERNCETMSLGQRFDLIVMSDVIEHVDAPVTAVRNLLDHLEPNGRLLITTPNATAANICLRGLIRRPFNVLYEHVTTFYPEHFQAISDRLGCRLDAIYMFDHIDHRSTIIYMKSLSFRLLTRLSPRWASAMLVVIGHPKHQLS